MIDSCCRWLMLVTWPALGGLNTDLSHIVHTCTVHLLARLVKWPIILRKMATSDVAILQFAKHEWSLDTLRGNAYVHVRHDKNKNKIWLILMTNEMWVLTDVQAWDVFLNMYQKCKWSFKRGFWLPTELKADGVWILMTLFWTCVIGRIHIAGFCFKQFQRISDCRHQLPA